MSHFIRRGYPKSLVLKALTRAESLNRDDLLNKETLTQGGTQLNDTVSKKFYCVTTHNPKNPPIRDIIIKNWEILGKTKTSRPLLESDIIFGLRRNKNLSDQLVRASTSNKSDDMKRKKQVDIKPCNRKSTCRYCPLLNVSGSFTCKTSNQIFPSKINVNCQTSNCIYLITCSTCMIQYVGQTKNKLLTRFNSHYYDIQHNNDTTVARHFNRCPCDNPAKFNGLTITILNFIRSPPDTRSGQSERDTEEKRWIHRLSSVVPRGLNLLD